MRRRFRNPGGATSAEAIGVDAGSSAARAARAVLERLGDRERGHPVRPGQLHREIAGEVAVVGVGRVLHFDRGTDRIVGERRERPVRDGPVPGAPDGIRTWVRMGVMTSGASGGALTGPHRSRQRGGRQRDSASPGSTNETRPVERRLARTRSSRRGRSPSGGGSAGPPRRPSAVPAPRRPAHRGARRPAGPVQARTRPRSADIATAGSAVQGPRPARSRPSRRARCRRRDTRKA